MILVQMVLQMVLSTYKVHKAVKIEFMPWVLLQKRFTQLFIPPEQRAQTGLQGADNTNAEANGPRADAADASINLSEVPTYLVATIRVAWTNFHGGARNVWGHLRTIGAFLRGALCCCCCCCRCFGMCRSRRGRDAADDSQSVSTSYA